jgi:hypothetical protein
MAVRRAGMRSRLRLLLGVAHGVCAAACSGDPPPAGELLWQHTFDVENHAPFDCGYLTVERSSDAIAELGDQRLRLLASDGTERWHRDFGACLALWDDQPGIGSLQTRLDVKGSEVMTYRTELGRIAVRDSSGHPIALGDELAKFDVERNVLWRVRMILELGTPRAQGLAVDADDAVIMSWAGSFCDQANVLRKYTADGALQWSTCLPLGQAAGSVPIAVDGTDIVIAGTAPGSLSQGGAAQDWLLQRYDAAGALRWSKPLAALITSRDGSTDTVENALAALAIDRHGNSVVVGRVLGRRPEVSEDIWIRKLDRDGHELWTQVIAGKPRLDDQAAAVAIDARDQVYVLGYMDRPAMGADRTAARLWLGKFAP